MPSQHRSIDASALAVVDVTTATTFSADAASDAWARMKAARGQTFDPSRMRRAHMVDAATPDHGPTVTTIEEIRVRALTRIRTRINQISGGAA